MRVRNTTTTTADTTKVTSIPTLCRLKEYPMAPWEWGISSPTKAETPYPTTHALAVNHTQRGGSAKIANAMGNRKSDENGFSMPPLHATSQVRTAISTSM